MTSITRRLHFRETRRRFSSAILVSVVILILAFLAYAAYHELQEFGTIYPESRRYFELKKAVTPEDDPGFWHLPVLYYCADDPIGTKTVKAEIFPIGLVILCPVVIILIFRILGIIFSWHSDNKKIRRILNPINELALKADELSKLSFSENKYHVLENAISHIDPDEMQTLSLEDSDLAGVEAAMNNLLIRMKESYQQQARFVNDASHELRTPIAIIEGYANMLDRWGMEDKKVLSESITAIKNESSHMKHLVEQLLFLARGDSGRTTLQLEPVSLKDMMQEIYEESLMIDELHQYRYDAPENDIVVQADPGLLKQAVRILVDNAAKYTKERDEIILSTGENEGHPYLQVQDSGIGMAESDIVHMFDRFYRSDEVRKYKGTGLGLSISKWIVDKHNGHFEITSRKDIGTRIRIVL